MVLENSIMTAIETKTVLRNLDITILILNLIALPYKV